MSAFSKAAKHTFVLQAPNRVSAGAQSASLVFRLLAIAAPPTKHQRQGRSDQCDPRYRREYPRNYASLSQKADLLQIGGGVACGDAPWSRGEPVSAALKLRD
jgi:hypothetical protein